jgi:hypothetical protein
VRGTWGDTIVDNPGTGVCAQPDTDGRLLLGPFQPGTVQLFVAPRDLAGAQWLGRSGGTGDRRTAAPLELKAGQVTAAPEIIAAPARSISGTIRRAENGDLLTDACASVAPVLYSCAGGGSYRLDGLGPYPWQVKYAEVDSAAIRTGESGAPATTDLSSGSVTDANARLGFGTWVPVALTGMQVEYAQFTAYDAYTGMVVGGGPSGYGVRVPPNRAVVLKVVYDNNTCWGYFGLGSRTTPYLAVGTTEPKQVNLTPGKNCLTREPFRSPVRMRPLPGPVVVKTFSPGPWLRGAAGAGVVANGSAVTSPWGVPTDARLARVKN